MGKSTTDRAVISYFIPLPPAYGPQGTTDGRGGGTTADAVSSTLSMP